MYKRLGAGLIDSPRASSLHRQARADALPAPANRGDIARLLSDTAGAEYPLYRPYTLATLLLEGQTGQLDVWCCGHSAISGASPVYSWHLPSFFGKAAALY